MITLTETNPITIINRLVEISLFTWRRAESDDPIDDDERYGWWGDSYPAVSNNKIGSRLWLLKRRKLDIETQRDAEHYIKEAMQWLVDDFLINKFAVSLQRIELDQLKATIVCYLPNDSTISYIVNDIWGVTQNAV